MRRGEGRSAEWRGEQEGGAAVRRRGEHEGGGAEQEGGGASKAAGRRGGTVTSVGAGGQSGEPTSQKVRSRRCPGSRQRRSRPGRPLPVLDTRRGGGDFFVGGDDLSSFESNLGGPIDKKQQTCIPTCMYHRSLDKAIKGEMSDKFGFGMLTNSPARYFAKILHKVMRGIGH
ncbi:hypothetical protein PR202_ga20984 [Eleusine coracana subsp. coracana]|uniref:Uncharacterized protein n=1 Tax=Eleusine coracana subsp. coracana TaxID=191504 RepID=A0AAV5CZR9_ELECO|nr:hypothetical protein PR202_ga20984 [Eleusine coracana subsp. coracana]